MTCPCGFHARGMISCSSCCDTFIRLTKEMNKIDRPKELATLERCERCDGTGVIIKETPTSGFRKINVQTICLDCGGRGYNVK